MRKELSFRSEMTKVLITKGQFGSGLIWTTRKQIPRWQCDLPWCELRRTTGFGCQLVSTSANCCHPQRRWSGSTTTVWKLGHLCQFDDSKYRNYYNKWTANSWVLYCGKYRFRNEEESVRRSVTSFLRFSSLSNIASSSNNPLVWLTSP